MSPQGGPRQLRGRARVVTENTAQKIAQHQNELHAGRQKAGLEKYGDQDGEGSQGEERRVFQKYESYKREAQMPNELSDLRVGIYSTCTNMPDDFRSLLMPGTRLSSCRYTVRQLPFISTQSKTSQKRKKEITQPCASILSRPDRSLVAKRMSCVFCLPSFQRICSTWTGI